MLFRLFLCFYMKTNALLFFHMLFLFKPMRFRWFLIFNTTNAFSFVPMLVALKPLCSCWFLCFAQSNPCFFVGTYAFSRKTNILFHCFLCFSHSSQSFLRWFIFVHIKTNAFSLAHMLFNVKSLLFCFFLCFSKCIQCFSVGS